MREWIIGKLLGLRQTPTLPTEGEFWRRSPQDAVDSIRLTRLPSPISLFSFLVSIPPFVMPPRLSLNIRI